MEVVFVHQSLLAPYMGPQDSDRMPPHIIRDVSRLEKLLVRDDGILAQEVKKPSVG